MGTKDKASNNTQDLKGKAKEEAGSATGNPATHPTTGAAMSERSATQFDPILGSVPPSGGNGLPDLAARSSPVTKQARGGRRQRQSREQHIRRSGRTHPTPGS
jgi:hypothetical protein